MVQMFMNTLASEASESVGARRIDACPARLALLRHSSAEGRLHGIVGLGLVWVVVVQTAFTKQRTVGRVQLKSTET